MSFMLTDGGKFLVANNGFAVSDACCCGKRVLLWRTNILSVPSTFVDLIAAYEDMGLIVDTDSTWTGDIHDYHLIFFLIAESDPTWWSTVTGGDWTGRVVMTAEHSGIPSQPSIDYVNSKSGITGISIIADDLDCIVCVEAIRDSMHALVWPWVPRLSQACTSATSGGTSLFVTVQYNQECIAVTDGPPVSWVIGGDSNPFDDACAADNILFFENLWNIAL